MKLQSMLNTTLGYLTWFPCHCWPVFVCPWLGTWPHSASSLSLILAWSLVLPICLAWAPHSFTLYLSHLHFPRRRPPPGRSRYLQEQDHTLGNILKWIDLDLDLGWGRGQPTKFGVCAYSPAILDSSSFCLEKRVDRWLETNIKQTF